MHRHSKRCGHEPVTCLLLSAVCVIVYCYCQEILMQAHQSLSVLWHFFCAIYHNMHSINKKSVGLLFLLFFSNHRG